MQEADTIFSHAAICVTDLEKSTRFYVEAFGLEFNHNVDVTPPFHILTELPDINGRATFFMKNGTKIELVEYATPEMIGPAQRRPMNQLGLTHIAFVVADLDATIANIVGLGGDALQHTRVSGPFGRMIFCTDPDGVRLEIWEKPVEG